MDKLKIEIWSDVMCPFCYIGKRRIEQALADFPHNESVEIEWKSYQLDPEAPKNSPLDSYDYLANRYGKDRTWSIETHNQVTEQAKLDGLEYRFDRSVVANSFDAHRLSHFAKSKGKGNELEELIFKAYFTDGKNVSDLEMLVELGKSVGLDENELRTVLESDQYSDEVKIDIHEANQIGVRGVPFFVFDSKYAVSGAQPREAFDQTLAKAWEEFQVSKA